MSQFQITNVPFMINNPPDWGMGFTLLGEWTESAALHSFSPHGDGLHPEEPAPCQQNLEVDFLPQSAESDGPQHFGSMLPNPLSRTLDSLESNTRYCSSRTL